MASDPRTETPKTPQATACNTAPPVKKGACDSPSFLISSPPCDFPSGVETLALRSAAAPVKGTAVMPVLFLHMDLDGPGTASVVSWRSAH